MISLTGIFRCPRASKDAKPRRTTRNGLLQPARVERAAVSLGHGSLGRIRHGIRRYMHKQRHQQRPLAPTNGGGWLCSRRDSGVITSDVRRETAVGRPMDGDRRRDYGGEPEDIRLTAPYSHSSLCWGPALCVGQREDIRCWREPDQFPSVLGWSSAQNSEEPTSPARVCPTAP